MMEIKLKPCPFCGGSSCIDGEIAYIDERAGIVYEVRCTECAATIDRWFDSEAEAIEAWNRRPAKWIYDEKDALFHCSICWGGAISNAYDYCPNCGAKMDKGESE